MQSNGAETIKFTVDEQSSSIRLDKLLCLHFSEYSRSFFTSLIENGSVSVNGRAAVKNIKPKCNDVIAVEFPPPVSLEAEAENIPLDVVYEDADVIVVNKPKGMVVHPAHGNENGTLVNALLYHCDGSLSGINGVLRPGIVHRIDKDTSGLIVAAKNDIAHNCLAEQFKDHSIIREYRAIVCGRINAEQGTVDKPIGRHPVKRKEMCCSNPCNPKRAVTHYEVIERFDRYTYVRCVLETGRTHQIRVHFADMGHALVGDTVYGKSVSGLKLDFDGQCLHAKTLGFKLPNGEYVKFESELPDYFTNLLNKLRRM